jgi:GNAT superfamily N-acetyltransferase
MRSNFSKSGIFLNLPIMSANLAIRSLADAPHLQKAATAIEQVAWNETGYLNYTRAHYEYYSALLNRHPEYQLCLVNEDVGYPVAMANSVPFACGDLDSLPPEGWDWVVETAACTNDDPVDMLGALAISVPAVHRLKGYGRFLIRALLDLAKVKGLQGVVAPVRPSAKVRHPWVPISEYLSWTDEKGRLYDPWLRSHLSLGGRLVGPCERSMVVSEPIAFWENWSNQSFESSGAYTLEGAIAPVKIDVDRQTGIYEEPNVWVAYGI